MAKIIISIHPENVRNIIKDEKKYEYRTRVAKRQIESILVYETSPTKKVVAEVQVINILSDSPKELWKKTKNHSGITKEFFDKYFYNRKTANAYALGKVQLFEEPKELTDF